MFSSSQFPASVYNSPPTPIENTSNQTLNSINVHHFRVPILVPVIMHVKVVAPLYGTIFDGREDHGFRPGKSKIRCCWHSDHDDLLDLAVKSLEFQFWCLAALVCILIDI